MASDEEPIDLDEYELDRINQEVEKIEELVNEFCDIQGRSRQDIRRASRKRKRIKNLGQSTMSRIKSLKDEMNGEKQRVGHQRDQSYQESWASLRRTETQAQRLLKNWSEMSPMGRAVDSFSAGFNAVCTYNDYQTSWHSQVSLKVLREKLLKVIRQQDKLKDLLDKVEEEYEKMLDECFDG